MPEILALVGPSGSGKTTLARELLRQLPEARMITSCTTRARRDTDLPSEYEYQTVDDFMFNKTMDLFVWTVDRKGVFYGTMRDEIFNFCDIAGEPAIGIMILVPDKVIELRQLVRGQYRDEVPIIPVFIKSPGDGILYSRLRERGESHEQIMARRELEAEWLRAAKSAPFPYHFVDGGRTLEELPRALSQIRTFLGA